MSIPLTPNQVAFIWFMSGLVSGVCLFQIGLTILTWVSGRGEKSLSLEARVKSLEDYIAPLRGIGDKK